jgi:hypothetical protein
VVDPESSTDTGQSHEQSYVSRCDAATKATALGARVTGDAAIERFKRV